MVKYCYKIFQNLFYPPSFWPILGQEWTNLGNFDIYRNKSTILRGVQFFFLPVEAYFVDDFEKWRKNHYFSLFRKKFKFQNQKLVVKKALFWKSIDSSPPRCIPFISIYIKIFKIGPLLTEYRPKWLRVKKILKNFIAIFDQKS